MAEGVKDRAGHPVSDVLKENRTHLGTQQRSRETVLKLFGRNVGDFTAMWGWGVVMGVGEG